MLQGFFDDSGTHKSSSAITMAGYIASPEGWASFERDASVVFLEHQIETFHAIEFNHRKNEFRGWSVARQMRFATELFDVAKQHVSFGAACSITKKDFEQVRKASGRLPSTSAYGYCLQIIMEKLAQNGSMWGEISARGLSITLEGGNTNNKNVAQEFQRIRTINGLETVLHVLDFTTKSSCRAVQLADYLAYFSWRLADAAVNEKVWGKCPLLTTATERVRTVGCLAEAFNANANY